MVCSKCQKKLSKNITPDPYKWDKKAKRSDKNISKMLENRLNDKKKKKKCVVTFTQLIFIHIIIIYRFKKGPNGKCRICKGNVHQKTYYYCQPCAYQKGICAMCGKKLHDIKNYCQSNV